MKCLLCDKFDSWNEDRMIRHIFDDHFIWTENEEWVHNGSKWERKKVKKLVFIEKL